MRPHSAAIWELLREIWEWRAWNGNHPWLAACTLRSRVDPGLVIFFEDSISSPVVPFISILLTSKCPFNGPYLLTNPVPWVETRKSVYHQIHSPYPWISKFRAKKQKLLRWSPGASLGSGHSCKQIGPQRALHNALQARPGSKLNNIVPYWGWFHEKKLLFFWMLSKWGVGRALPKFCVTFS